MKQNVKSTLKSGILEMHVNGNFISTLFSTGIIQILKTILDLYLECISWENDKGK